MNENRTPLLRVACPKCKSNGTNLEFSKNITKNTRLGCRACGHSFNMEITGDIKVIIQIEEKEDGNSE